MSDTRVSETCCNTGEVNRGGNSQNLDDDGAPAQAFTAAYNKVPNLARATDVGAGEPSSRFVPDRERFPSNRACACSYAEECDEKSDATITSGAGHTAA